MNTDTLASSRLRVLVGTYNAPGTPGAYLFDIEPDSGRYELIDSIAVDNPSFMAINPNDPGMLFAISENAESNSMLSLFVRNSETGRYQLTDATKVHGSPCYVSTDGTNVVTANYGGGSINVFRLETAEDGRPALTDNLQYFVGRTGGSDTVRQCAPHIHCVTYSPEGRHLYATDFSSDRILYFDIDPTTRLLIPMQSDTVADSQRFIQLPDGTGPRHLIFDRTGSHAYLIGELSGMVTVFQVESDGALRPLQTVEADPAHRRGSSHLALSNDGRTLYVSNRLGSDGITTFAVCSNSTPHTRGSELTDNSLTDELSVVRVGEIETGLHPRHFAISSDDRYLIVAARDSNRLEIHPLGHTDQATTTIPVSRPVFVLPL